MPVTGGIICIDRKIRTLETTSAPNKTKLFLPPGPVPVPDFVREAMAQPIIHHRGPDFSSLMEDVLRGLRYFFQTEQTTGLMIGSGTFGVETGMYSLFRQEETVLIVNNGKFSSRWVEYGEVLGLDIQELSLEWGEAPAFESIVDLAGENAPSGIVLTHSETSTGTLTDLEPLALRLRQTWPDICILVDTITSTGALPFYLDEWEIDAAVSASQKALMNPAGIVCFGLSSRGRSRLKPTRAGDFANWYNYVRSAETLSFPFTPPLLGIYGLQAALHHIQERRLPSIWNRVHQCSRKFKLEVEKIGGKVCGASPSDSLTAFEWTTGSTDDVRTYLLERNIELAGGQGIWKGKILRMSHMGTSAQIEIVDRVLSALREYSPRN